MGTVVEVLGPARCLAAVVLAAATIGAATPSASPAPARAAATVTVSGTVLDPAGNPVVGAEIWDGYRNGFLFGDDAADGYCAGRNDRSDVDPLATTDSAGRFTFTCEPGFYAYAVDPAGTYANSSGDYVSGASAAAVLRLKPLPTDMVTVRGVVLDPDGMPVRRAQIWDAYDNKGDRGLCAEVGRVDVPRAVSARDGSFRVDCYSQDGWVQLMAWKTGQDFIRHTASEWFTGHNAGTTFRFFRKLGAVTGRIFGPGNTPIAGTDVALVGNCYIECASTTTGVAGRYLFEELVPWSRYCIRYYDYGAELSDYCFEATQDTLVVPDQQVSEQITGTLRGKVKDLAGAPIAGATVSVPAFDLEATTDAAGAYVIRDVPPSGWPVDAWAPGYDGKTATAYIQRDDTSRLTFKLEKLPPPPDNLPTASFTSARTDGRLVVRGVAQDDHGVAGARVAVQDVATGKWLRADGAWGAYQQLPAEVATPGSRYTTWTFRRASFTPGRYGVSMIAVDTTGQLNASPRPWRILTVQP